MSYHFQSKEELNQGIRHVIDISFATSSSFKWKFKHYFFKLNLDYFELLPFCKLSRYRLWLSVKMSFCVLTDYEILMFRLQIITAKNTPRVIYDTH